MVFMLTKTDHVTKVMLVMLTKVMVFMCTQVLMHDMINMID